MLYLYSLQLCMYLEMYLDVQVSSIFIKYHYTPWVKKQDMKLLSISFSKFFHWCAQQEIGIKMIIIDSIAPSLTHSCLPPPKWDT